MSRRNHKKKLANNLDKTVKEFIFSKKYKPLTFHEIAAKLSLAKENKQLLKIILNKLIKSGELSFHNKKYLPSDKSRLPTKGILRLHHRGFGFVELIDFPNQKDVFIPKSKIDDAVDGDIVEVKISSKISPKGPEGEIIGVIKRGRTHLAGTVSHKQDNVYIVLAPILGADKFVMICTDKKLKAGDRIVMEVTSWNNRESQIQAKYVKKIGHISDPGYDLQAAVEEYEIRNTFTAQLMDEVKQIGSSVEKKDCKDRVDLTDLETVTIDPISAKDFDDALSLKKDKKGRYRLGVHIADVAYYIKTNTLLDKEAYARGNSTYFPGSCIPMLPQELSNGLCSLRPDVLRLCVSVLMTFTGEGKLEKYEIVRSFIKSRKRFTYEEAFSILENKKKSPFTPLLHLMKELCAILKKHRFQRGSIDFALPDSYIEVDEKGEPLSIQTVEYDISHQIVEEFMLKANELVAKHLVTKQTPPIYRVHDRPSDENLNDFFTLVKSYGFRVFKNPSQKQLQSLFLKVKNSPYWKDISVAFIRSMKMANYSSENLGHYGLALEYYCHFTSPIRRYSDLVIQRLLFSQMPAEEKLSIVAQHCSDQERKSMKAENSMILLKKMRLLEKELKQNPNHLFSGTITRIKPFAIYFDIHDFFMENSLHVNEIEQDYFIYHPKLNLLSGRHTNIKYRLGDEVWLKLLDVNLTKLHAKWTIIKKSSPKK